MRIRKTSQYIEGGASLSNTYGTSQENGYTQEYINGLNTYSTDEVRVGTWIDGKPLYRKVVSSQLPQVSTNGTSVDKTVSIADNINLAFIESGYIISSANFVFKTSYINDNTVVDCYINSSKKLYLTSNTIIFNNSNIYAIILYTKTTD